MDSLNFYNNYEKFPSNFSAILPFPTYNVALSLPPSTVLNTDKKHWKNISMLLVLFHIYKNYKWVRKRNKNIHKKIVIVTGTYIFEDNQIKSYWCGLACSTLQFDSCWSFQLKELFWFCGFWCLIIIFYISKWLTGIS